MNREYYTQSEEELRVVAQEFSHELSGGSFVALSGSLGAGKTTFSQGLLGALGAFGPFSSPTFVIVKHYDLRCSVRDILRVYHIDAYRISSNDLSLVGWEEMISDKHGVVLLEWPEQISDAVPSCALRVLFEIVNGGQGRRVVFS
ncbi:MAG: tRNA (adenosine(37)-N6)-threonylcarbamoyltransferase complex ATPase subunit type 1 TsaE [Candidatus Moranbacteria bacterium]|nr:tRNA (adenosine(37)-N6)-threonylcarbamoyltransferase complex ATPase subunit type 1 TsaE [Candidatus Moranbacteria bacterium]